MLIDFSSDNFCPLHVKGTALPSEEITPQLREFIAAHITSVAQLEILLLLKTNPTQSWTPELIARELRIDPKAAAEQLAGLLKDGFLVSDAPAAYRYAPKSPALDEGVIALAQAYLVRRVTITGLIFSQPNRVIRAFSDAFRIRKDEPHGG